MDSRWEKQAAWCTRGFGGVVEKERFTENIENIESTMLRRYQQKLLNTGLTNRGLF